MIFVSTRYGYPLSTTHVVSGAVMGAGATKRLSAVRWGVAGNIVFAWVLHDPGVGGRRGARLVADQGHLRRMKFGVGAGSGTIYVLLTQAGEAALEVVRAVERRIVDWPAGPTQDEVKALEHVADSVVSELLSQTNTLFVTPFDREDVITLAFAVDDVADAAENASELFGLYGVESPTKQAFAAGCAARAGRGASRGPARRPEGRAWLADEILRIKEIEDEADTVARAARASLFKDDRIDPVVVIRWKDIYEALEDAVDACETAAHRVGNILVKNA